MLPEIAIADAYCMAWEFSNNKNLICDFSKFYNSGIYGDDTQCSIAISEWMLNNTSLSQYSVAKHLLQSFHRDIRKGYASGFYRILLASKTPEKLFSLIKPWSIRNGAAMRSIPIGLIKERKKVIDTAISQASVTHATTEGIKSSIAIALLSHAMYFNIVKRSNVGKWIKKWVNGPWDIPYNDGPVECDGMQTAHAAIHIVQTSSSLTNIIKKSIDIGGDTDTVAAIAVGAGSLTKTIKNNLRSTHLWNNIEKGKYGIDYLSDLDAKMFKHFPSKYFKK